MYEGCSEGLQPCNRRNRGIDGWVVFPDSPRVVFHNSNLEGEKWILLSVVFGPFVFGSTFWWQRVGKEVCVEKKKSAVRSGPIQRELTAPQVSPLHHVLYCPLCVCQRQHLAFVNCRCLWNTHIRPWASLFLPLGETNPRLSNEKQATGICLLSRSWFLCWMWETSLDHGDACPRVHRWRPKHNLGLTPLSRTDNRTVFFIQSFGQLQPVIPVNSVSVPVTLDAGTLGSPSEQWKEQPRSWHQKNTEALGPMGVGGRHIQKKICPKLKQFVLKYKPTTTHLDLYSKFGQFPNWKCDHKLKSCLQLHKDLKVDASFSKVTQRNF